MFKNLFRKKPPYLERIDELENVTVVRLKGAVDSKVIPLIGERIQENRRKGSKIDKHVIVDYERVTDVDSATVAFHLVRLKEYEAKGFKIGFIHVSEKLKILLDMFHQTKSFRIYASEEEALNDLNGVVE